MARRISLDRAGESADAVFWMQERDMESSERGRVIEGVLLMVGLIAGGYLLGSQVRDFKRADRYVEVKGLVERVVKSDQADWPLTFRTPGSDLSTVFAQSESRKNTVLQFLSEQGITAAEVTVGEIHVTDKQTKDFVNENDHGSRYIVEQTVAVSSKDVDKIARAGQKTADLVKAGVVLADSGGRTGGISYTFTGLNALKPDMITEATRNARASADRFAQDSGSQVGSIRSANQGVFSIAPAAEVATNADGEGGAGTADSSLMKKVRVVSTIDYYLVK
jgi:hypothetical protein